MNAHDTSFERMLFARRARVMVLAPPSLDSVLEELTQRERVTRQRWQTWQRLGVAAAFAFVVTSLASARNGVSSSLNDGLEEGGWCSTYSAGSRGPIACTGSPAADVLVCEEPLASITK